MICIYNKDEFCTNDECPMRADYCPVPDVEGVCKYEERNEEYYTVTPKGCLAMSLINNGIVLDDCTFNSLWDDFTEVMTELGYIQEED